MKRHNRLFEKIVSLPNLIEAYGQAAQGKRSKPSVAAFDVNMSKEVLRLREELVSKTYRPGAYTSFMVYDPKERMISAAPFRDRVVHHALCRVIEPIFEKTFVHDSYANRKGKGTHRAIERYQQFARRSRYVLKCDIRKFFPSLDHAVLKREIRWKIRCADTLWLIDLIIDGSNAQEDVSAWSPFLGSRRGLPIGNLTSQFWANVYLNRFDHFVQEHLRPAGYVRYVDDFVLFSDDKQQLAAWQEAMAVHLARLRLVLHPRKTHIHRTASGVPFLGFQVWPCHRVVRKANTRRYGRFLKKKLVEMRAGRRSPQHLEDGLNSWLGHVRFGQCKRLEDKVFWRLRSAGVNVLDHPNGSWRVLQRS